MARAFISRVNVHWSETQPDIWICFLWSNLGKHEYKINGFMSNQRVSSYLRGASESCCSGCTSPPGAARPSWHRTRSRPCGRRRSRWSAAEAAGRMWWWWSPPSTCPGCSYWPLPASCRAGSCSAGWSPPEEARQDITHHFYNLRLDFAA